MDRGADFGKMNEAYEPVILRIQLPKSNARRIESQWSTVMLWLRFQSLRGMEDELAFQELILIAVSMEEVSIFEIRA